MSSFDPYHRWLGIPPREQPGDYYRILGLVQYESDIDVIRDAAERQIAHVRRNRLGDHSLHAERILAELAEARSCLLDPGKRAAYDARLKASSEDVDSSAVVAPIAPPGNTSLAAPPAAASSGVFAASPHGTARPKAKKQSTPPAWLIPTLATVGSVIAICVCVAFVLRSQRTQRSAIDAGGLAQSNSEPVGNASPRTQPSDGGGDRNAASATGPGLQLESPSQRNGGQTTAASSPAGSESARENSESTKGPESTTETEASGVSSGDGKSSKVESSKVRLKRIALALHRYHDKNGEFPPAFTLHRDGTPQASWRALLLPYLDPPSATTVDINRKWDDPANQRSRIQEVAVYRSSEVSGGERNESDIFFITGPGTPFDGPKPSRMSDFRRGTRNTVLAVELFGQGIEWSEPRDIPLDELDDAFKKQARDRDSVNVIMADGSVRDLPIDDAEKELMEMARIRPKQPVTKVATKSSSTRPNPLAGGTPTKKNRNSTKKETKQPTSPLDSLLLRNRIFVGNFFQRTPPTSSHFSRIVILRKTAKERWEGRWEYATQTMTTGQTNRTGFVYGVTLTARRPNSDDILIHAKGILANPRGVSLNGAEFSVVAKIVNGRIVGKDIAMAPAK